MRRKHLYLIGTLLALLASSLAVTAIWRQHAAKSPDPIPVSLAQQISFVAYLPGEGWQSPTAEMTYQNNVLTVVSSQRNVKMTITQQATPDIFNDVAQYYPSLLDKLNQYASIGTANGTAYLTHPKELGGQQQAVLNNNGTLLFAHPDHDLSNDDWRRLFNNLQVIKPN